MILYPHGLIMVFWRKRINKLADSMYFPRLGQQRALKECEFWRLLSRLYLSTNVGASADVLSFHRASNNANNDAADAVRNFLASIQANQKLGGGGGQSAQGKLYPLLSDLLEPSTTIPMLDSASDEYVDNLLSYLPPMVLVLSQQGENGDDIDKEPSAEAVEAAKQAMSSGQKRALLKKVLRSPQFTQSLASLTSALRDGGLPTVAGSLGIAVENGGLVRGGSVPLGGGDAVEAFVEGVKKTVQKK